ncbi:serine/threonine-protein kinase ULK3-like [Dendronephthya gigantea]|uniref:serine/threonine-protein kinase ULK3-like n=1 Tax=Dendronephthya gigantea TaxID=151771 RepID=UPI00106A4926|nr:serine/threonine-protein kinase ULK3-like [Dendronephthya gigantea]
MLLAPVVSSVKFKMVDNHNIHLKTTGGGVNSLPPPRLEHFVMTEKLGQGTYASVYKAYRKGQAREVVAIKCIYLKRLGKAAIENLFTEIKLLKEINHDHVVQLKDFEWNKDYLFLIMEYCSGGDLSRFIQTRRQLPENIAKRFLQQLALALQCLHSRDIAHMDLKPQNILLSSKDNPTLKIADFGFAQYLKDEMDSSNLRGSPLYMAPEMFCSTTYDASVDLWSVGVILYEALFGVAPFRSRTFSELEKKIRSTQEIRLPQDSNVSQACKELLLSLLQRDPKQRISFDEFFAHPFLDLEHAPSASCLPQAISLVAEAVKLDQALNYKDAVKMYCQALDYFVPALQYEQNSSKRNSLREKVNGYVARAEEIKQLLKQRSASQASREPMHVLRQYAKTNPQLADGLKLAEIAEIRDENGVFPAALEQYRTALAVLIPILKDLPSSKVKDVLGSEVQRFMRRAEEIKAYLKTSEEKTLAIGQEVDERMCCIQ